VRRALGLLTAKKPDVSVLAPQIRCCPITVGPPELVPAVALLGDVGGRVDQLRQALAHLGVGDDVWPAGQTAVQVGDLLGGLDDNEVLRCG
jgi:hypothetical protein